MYQELGYTEDNRDEWWISQDECDMDLEAIAEGERNEGIRNDVRAAFLSDAQHKKEGYGEYDRAKQERPDQKTLYQARNARRRDAGKKATKRGMGNDA